MNHAVLGDQKLKPSVPTDLLQEIADNRTYGCLKTSSNSVDWLIYFHAGRITYATNSVSPFERFERNLRRLKRDPFDLINAVRQHRQLEADKQSSSSPERPEYQSICWLVQKNYLPEGEAASLVKQLTKEVIESYLLGSEIHQKNLIEFIEDVESPNFCHLELQSLLDECIQKLQSWQALAPQICSSYQRPYFANTAHRQNQLPAAQVQRLSKVLKGLNFRQLTVVFNQDELQIAQKLYPLIAQKIIVLREPQSPFDKLPKIPASFSPVHSQRVAKDRANGTPSPAQPATSQDNNAHGASTPQMPQAASSAKIWKIACVDDSPTVLNEINRLLESPNIAISKIDDPLKALLKIVQIKPDLIMLDVGMPNIDGYNLCSLLRKNSQFKSTPIVMVTGHKGLIDRAKAKLAGATDYLTKPFSKEDLLNIVSKYLKN